MASLSLVIATAITLQVRRLLQVQFAIGYRRLMTVHVSKAGLLQFLLGFLRLGFIDVVLSRALLRGFITAVAVVIMMHVKFLVSRIGAEFLVIVNSSFRCLV